jgi:hypothetical protein
MADISAVQSFPYHSKNQDAEVTFQNEVDILNIIKLLSEDGLYHSQATVSWTISEVRNFILLLSAIWDRLAASDNLKAPQHNSSAY